MPLTIEEVLEKMKDPGVVLLNILPEKDFEKLHIKDSQSLTLGHNIRGFGFSATKKYPKQTFFITYAADENGTASLNAAKILSDKGFKADNYPGGLEEWSQAGLPLDGTEKGAPHQTFQLKKKKR